MSEKNTNKNVRDSARTEVNAEKDTKRTPSYIIRAVPVVLCALALFITLCFITAETGAFGSFISRLFKGLFSYMAYTIPAFLVLHAITFHSDYKNKKIVSRVIFTSVSLITLSMIAFLIPNMNAEVTYSASEFYNGGIENRGGGFIGGSVAYGLTRLFGFWGLLIIIALVFAIYVIFFFSGRSGEVAKFLLKKLAAAVNFGAKMEKRSEEKKKKKLAEKQEKKRAIDQKRNSEFYNDEFFYADNGVSKLEIPELGIVETKEGGAGKYILRENVSHNAGEDISEEVRTVNTDYEDSVSDSEDYEVSGNDIIIDSDEPEFPKAEAEPVKTARDYGIDDSADAIFTAEFDPYDIALNEKLASKLSSRAEAERSEAGGFSEFIADLTPEEAERLRRLKEFEQSRQAAIRRREQAEAARREAEEAARLAAEEEERRLEEEAVAQKARLEEERLADEERNSQEQMSAEAARADEEAAKASAYTAPTELHYEQRPQGGSYGRVAEIVSINNDYEKQYGAERQAPAGSGYRYVGNTVKEERLPYSGSEVRVEYRDAQRPVSPSYESVGRTVSSTDAYAEKTKKAYDAPAREYSFEQNTAYQGTSERYAPTSAETHYVNVKETFTAEETRNEVKLSFEAEEPIQKTTLGFEEEPKRESTLSFDEEPKREAALSFDAEPSYEANDGAEEYTDDKFTPSEESTLEVTRTMLSPEEDSHTEEIKLGLDFSSDDDEEDESEEFGDEDAESYQAPTQIPPEEQNPKISEYQGMFDIFKSDAEDAGEDNEDTVADEEYEDVELESEEDITEDYEDSEDALDEPPFDAPAPAHKEEKKAPPKIDYSNYKFPPIDLLRKGKDEDTSQINDEIQQGAEQLINTLDSFNITATVRGIERGPRITRYSIVPAKGIRVNQIEKLSDDISLAMAAESIRIEAPIPGKSAVGIEVPNKVPSLVSLRDLLESDEFVNEKSKTTVCIGKSVEGTLVFGDIGTMPHLLIAGATGMGKSVCMNSLITSILYKARPDEVKFIMIDPKKVEFAPYNGIPHLLVPVVTDPKQAAGTLMWAVDEMNKRYDIIEKLCVRGIDSYNEKVAENPELGAPMPKIIIFIDELNDLMIQVRDPVENLIMLIAQKARAAGIHLVIGTQRPSVNVITGVIKANIPSRIACKVSSGIDSRTILEQTGAEKLIGKGDMLFAPGGKPNPKRVQGAFVSEGETAAIVDFVKRQVKGDMYDEQAMEDMKRAAQKCDKSKNGDGDDGFDDDEESSTGFLHDRKFLNAVELAIRNGSVATSFLQRKLHIGYGKAAQYIDIMEDLGVVGEKNGSKARDILISMSEWQEKLSRLTLDD